MQMCKCPRTAKRGVQTSPGNRPCLVCCEEWGGGRGAPACSSQTTTLFVLCKGFSLVFILSWCRYHNIIISISKNFRHWNRHHLQNQLVCPLTPITITSKKNDCHWVLICYSRDESSRFPKSTHIQTFIFKCKWIFVLKMTRRNIHIGNDCENVTNIPEYNFIASTRDGKA